MDTERITLLLQTAQAAREKAKLTFARNARYAEFKRFYSGGMMVFTGLMLATLYCLLTHQIQN